MQKQWSDLAWDQLADWSERDKKTARRSHRLSRRARNTPPQHTYYCHRFSFLGKAIKTQRNRRTPHGMRLFRVSIMRDRLRLFQAVDQTVDPVHRFVH